MICFKKNPHFHQYVFVGFSSRTATDPSNTTRTDNQNFSTDGVSPVHIDRAIEIVIDSIQSLEGAVNNFDQLFFSLIYGRLNTRTEYDGTEVSSNKNSSSS